MDQKESSESTSQPPHEFWHWLWKPSRRWYLLGLPVGTILAFVVGILVTAGVLRPTVEYAETDAFCTSCHEMQTPYVQLQHSYHWSNEFGIRPSCGDCHIPPGLIPGVVAHIEATRDIWGHITGVIDTPAKFEQNKLRMAEIVWGDMKAQNSAGCGRCHSFAAMALDKQSHAAAKHHSPEYIAKTGKTCIDCHKGVAHELPTQM